MNKLQNIVNIKGVDYTLPEGVSEQYVKDYVDNAIAALGGAGGSGGGSAKLYKHTYKQMISRGTVVKIEYSTNPTPLTFNEFLTYIYDKLNAQRFKQLMFYFDNIDGDELGCRFRNQNYANASYSVQWLVDGQWTDDTAGTTSSWDDFVTNNNITEGSFSVTTEEV